MRRVVSQGWLHASWRPRFTASHLSWTTHPRLQRQAPVKVHGSFRPTTGTRHLHRDYSFTGSLVETAPKSLRHSCRSELRVHPLFPEAQTIPSPCDSFTRMADASYRLFPLGFISEAILTISARPSARR